MLEVVVIHNKTMKKLELFPFHSFLNKPWFLRVCSTSLLKKEKFLVMSNISFSHSIFYPLENFLPFSLNSFSLEEPKICPLGKS